MSAPLLWIFIPVLAGACLLLVKNQKFLALFSGLLCSFLAIVAFLLPIDEPVSIQAFSFIFTPSFEVLGRAFILLNSDRGWLVLLFGASAVWFTASSSINIARRLVPLGLVISGLLVAALAVEPFLYAALLMEVAVLLSIPLLSPPGIPPGNGALRFLVLQTLAMPFLLLSGWLLAGISANPGNLDLVVIAAGILGLGFALLLAVFPFYTWIPLISEQVHPYIAGFILWSFPTVGMFFAMNFLDRYAWLREMVGLSQLLNVVGIVMVVSAGIFIFFQQHLGRIFGYAVMMEIGFSLICVGFGSSTMEAYLLLYAPRLVTMALWAFALTNLWTHFPSLSIKDMEGTGRKWIVSSISLLLAGLTMGGLPLLAAFPPRLVIWKNLAIQSGTSLTWVFIGSMGMIIGTIRGLTALLSIPKVGSWRMSESLPQKIFLLLAVLALLIMGIFPSLVSSVWQNMPPLFEHLGQ